MLAGNHSDAIRMSFGWNLDEICLAGGCPDDLEVVSSHTCFRGHPDDLPFDDMPGLEDDPMDFDFMNSHSAMDMLFMKTLIILIGQTG